MGHAKTPEEEEMATLTNEMVLMALNRVPQIFLRTFTLVLPVSLPVALARLQLLNVFIVCTI